MAIAETENWKTDSVFKPKLDYVEMQLDRSCACGSWPNLKHCHEGARDHFYAQAREIRARRDGEILTTWNAVAEQWNGATRGWPGISRLAGREWQLEKFTMKISEWRGAVHCTTSWWDVVDRTGGADTKALMRIGGDSQRKKEYACVWTNSRIA